MRYSSVLGLIGVLCVLACLLVPTPAAAQTECVCGPNCVWKLQCTCAAKCQTTVLRSVRAVHFVAPLVPITTIELLPAARVVKQVQRLRAVRPTVTKTRTSCSSCGELRQHTRTRGSINLP